ncbi:MAG: ABC transporter ATP-binding protein [Flavobacteriaceae bacterium]|nr:ABC transporter ATP-binding protein [Flavobacteriaceae bacterium]
MATNKSNTILKTENLSIGYTVRKKALIIQENLNLELKRGVLTCILGNNGIGKSTLLRTLAKMQPALSGSVLIDNKNSDDYTSQELSKKISLVLTESVPPSNLSVFELVALGRQPYTNWIGTLSDIDKTMVTKAMQQTEITNLVSKKIFELSDGQKQRVMIARALAQNTEIIILDEPTVHLDIHHKIAVLKLLKNISKNLNKSIIIATHEVSFAIQLADTLWLMHPNKCVTGTPDALITNKTLQELFNSNLISFNSNTKQFNIKNT